MFPDAGTQFLGAHRGAGEFLEQSLPEQGLEDDPFVEADRQPPVLPQREELAVALESAESLKTGFASLDGGLNVLHQLLEAQMKGDGGIAEIVRLGDLVFGGPDGD